MSLEARLEAAGVPYITHAEWGADPWNWRTSSGGPLPQQTFPAQGFWIHHSVTGVDSFIEDLRELRDIGMSRFGRPSYPFAIHPSGAVGQLVFPYIGAHTAGFNSTSLAAVHVGNYETQEPTPEQLRANAVLIQALRDEGLLVPNHYIDGHWNAEGAQTACPGARLKPLVPIIMEFLADMSFEQADRDTLNNIYLGLYRRDYNGDGVLDTPFVADGVQGALDRLADLQSAVAGLQVAVAQIAQAVAGLSTPTTGGATADEIVDEIADRLNVE